MPQAKKDLCNIKTKLGYTVSCSEEAWDSHIITGHPIMEGNERAVIDSLVNPCIVYESGEDSNTDVFFGKSSQATYGDKLYTRCIVRKSPGGNWLTTSFPCREIGGNINEGVIKYVEFKS